MRDATQKPLFVPVREPAFVNGVRLYTVLVQAEQDVEYVPGRRPDETWSHTDSKGHWHAFAWTDNARATDAERLPTLKLQNVQVPCDGTGHTGLGECDGIRMEVHYFCAICDEPVPAPTWRECTEPLLGRERYLARVTGPAELYEHGGGQRVSLRVGDRFAVGHAELVGMVLSDGAASVVEMIIRFTRLHNRYGYPKAAS